MISISQKFHKNKKNNLYIANILVILLAILTVLFFFDEYVIASLDGIEKYVFVRTDFGQYLTDVRNYNTNTYIKNAMGFGRDPGLFILTSTLQKIAGFNDSGVLVFITGIGFFLTMMTSQVITRRFFPNKKTGFLVVLCGYFLFFQAHAFVFHNSRQAIGQSILFTLLYINIFHSRKVVIAGFLLAGCTLLHRVATVFGYLSILILTMVQTWTHKRIFLNGFYIILWYILFAFPFLLTSVVEWKNTVIWFFRERSQISGLGKPGQTKDLGFLWIKTTDNKISPLLNYFIFFPWICLTLISKIGWLKNEGVNHILYLSSGLCIYILLSITFSNRVLITLEWLLMILFLYALFKTRGLKKFKIFLITISVILNFSTLYKDGSALSRKLIYTLPGDKSVKVLEDLNKKPSFFFSDGGGADLLGQLNFPSMTNYFGLLNSEKKYSDIGIYSMFELSNLQVLNYDKKPYIHEVFKGYDLYLVSYSYPGDAMKNKLLKKINTDKGKNLSIIFSGGRENYFNLIIKINKDNISFFDNKNYFDLNIKDKCSGDCISW